MTRMEAVFFSFGVAAGAGLTAVIAVLVEAVRKTRVS